MKKHYLGTLQKEGKDFSVLMIAKNEKEAIKRYFECSKRHSAYTVPTNYINQIAEVWFIDEKVNNLPASAKQELDKYNSVLI